jgi:hypothetical protein
MFKKEVEDCNAVKITAMDSISHISEEDAGNIIVSGSHGGVSAGLYALKYPLAAVFFNDAGGGKEGAGIAALSMLQDESIPACTYSHNSARIGDAQDGWKNGVISHLNEAARQKGVCEGDLVKEAARRFALTAEA